MPERETSRTGNPSISVCYLNNSEGIIATMTSFTEIATPGNMPDSADSRAADSPPDPIATPETAAKPATIELRAHPLADAVPEMTPEDYDRLREAVHQVAR